MAKQGRIYKRFRIYKQIKEISVNSRNELMKIYDSKIYLKIFVKVSKN